MLPFFVYFFRQIVYDNINTATMPLYNADQGGTFYIKQGGIATILPPSQNIGKTTTYIEFLNL